MRHLLFLSLLSLCPLLFTAQTIPCIDGMAGDYPCEGFDFVSRVDLLTLGEPFLANDLWGWTDPETGVEYALLGLGTRTAFISLCDPEQPEYIGFLPTHTSASIWRDIKVYDDHAFIVSEASGHGLQVFDLRQLREVSAPPVEFEETAHLGNFGNAHNIAINEQTGFAYPIGAQTFSGGPIFIDISEPASPQPAGGYEGDGYSHDVQAVVYDGPDADYVGRELIFASNEDTFTIIDVEDKSDPTLLAREPYAFSQYAHQGWLTEDHRYFLMNDELDELEGLPNTRTIIWDCLDLDAPVVIGTFESPTAASDHNLYTHQGLCYQANYQSGLRVLDLADIATGDLEQIGFFDVYPQNDFNGFDGAWSVYPYFESGLVIISSQDRGLIVVKASDTALPPLCAPLSTIDLEQMEFGLHPNPSRDHIWLDLPGLEAYHYQILDNMGRVVQQGSIQPDSQGGLALQGFEAGLYHIRLWNSTQQAQQSFLFEGR